MDNQGIRGKHAHGFGRVDRYEISQPSVCQCCGSRELSEVVNIHTQQVASLVAKPIEVIEYQIETCKCLECGAVVQGDLPSGIVPSSRLEYQPSGIVSLAG